MGHVFATEVTDKNLQSIAERIEESGLLNITAVRGGELETGLTPGCCDAVLLRRVYHHFTQPADLRADLHRALRPGARLGVIEIKPQRDWGALDGVPERDGHGISRQDLIDEMTSEGLFAVVGSYDSWPEDEDNYCVVFERAADVGTSVAAAD